MSLLELIDQKRPEILRLATQHGGRDLRLFGSVARGEESPSSDVDLLLTIDDYFERLALEEELRQLLGVKVELVTTLSPYITDRVLSEAIPLAAPDFREQAVIQSHRSHMPVDRDGLQLLLMRDAAASVLRFADAGREEFKGDEMRRMATIKGMELIGESANRISVEFRAAHPEIDWARIIAFRNIAVHDYYRLDLDTVWQIVLGYVPELKAQLDKLI